MFVFQFENDSETFKQALPDVQRVVSVLGDGRCLGATDADMNLLGYCVLFPSCISKSCVVLNDIKVAPEKRETGIGTELLQNAAALARERDYKAILTTAVMGDGRESVQQLFFESNGFKKRNKDATRLSYTLGSLKDSNIMKIAHEKSAALPAVRPIPNRNTDIIARFESKALAEGFYFDKDFYDPNLTVFCEKDGDIIGCMRVEILADGSLRVADYYMDQHSGENLILPALLSAAISISEMHFGQDGWIQISIYDEKKVEAAIPLLGEPEKRERVAEYMLTL